MFVLPFLEHKVAKVRIFMIHSEEFYMHWLDAGWM